MREKTCLAVVVLLVALLAGAGLYLIWPGSAGKGADGRISIRISRPEAGKILADMRGCYQSLQEIMEALPSGDTDAMKEAADKAGRMDLEGLSPGLVARLPFEFDWQVMRTHRMFRRLARDLDNGLKKKDVLPRLALIMANCNGCHARYRLDLETGAARR